MATLQGWKQGVTAVNQAHQALRRCREGNPTAAEQSAVANTGKSVRSLSACPKTARDLVLRGENQA